MPHEKHTGARVRLFVAILPPKETIERMEKAIRKVRKLAPGAKWATPESAHLTVLYVGDTPAARIPKIREAVGAVAARAVPFDIHLAGLLTLGHPPHVLAVDVVRGRERMVALHDVLRHDVAFVQPVTERIYRPHLALAKMHGGAPALEEAAEQLQPLCKIGCDVKVREIVLFRSDIPRPGERRKFTMVDRFRLEGASAGVSKLPRDTQVEVVGRSVLLRFGTDDAAEACARALGPGWSHGRSVHPADQKVHVGPVPYTGHMVIRRDFRSAHEAAAAADRFLAQRGRAATDEDGLHKLLAAATAHGEESEEEHEVGDLQGYVTSAWNLLTMPQQTQVYAAHVPKRSAAARATGTPLYKVILHAQLHGNTSGLRHEVGDLQAVLRTCWALLTPAQRRAVYQEHAETVADWLDEDERRTR